MADNAQPPETCTRPRDHLSCLECIPTELHFHIINLALTAGQDGERDVSALARTSKTMHFIVNPELHRLVVKNQTFFLAHWAAQENHLDTLKFALAHGADPNGLRASTDPLDTQQSSFRPSSWTDWNLFAGNNLAVDLLQFWDTPLHIAAAYDRDSVAKALLANGAGVNRTAVQACRCRRKHRPTSLNPPIHEYLACSYAYTPLHVAVCMGSYKVAKLLVATGADQMVWILYDNGNRQWLPENALHRALSWRGNLRLDYNFIEFLLDNGYSARIDERNFDSMTPLHLACQFIHDPGQMDIVRLLLRYGADPDSQGPRPPGSQLLDIPHRPYTYISPSEMATPALWATRQGHFQIAKLLLDHGADARARSSIVHETMLLTVCTARKARASPDDITNEQRRMELLDTLLAGDAAKDLNTFYENDRNLLKGLIRAVMRGDLPRGLSGELVSKVFAAGADILAGADMGIVTPFEHMITDIFDDCVVHLHSTTPMGDIVDNLLVILKASGISKHRYKPTAMLNQFWGHLKRGIPHSFFGYVGFVPHILLALIRTGFSPAEVDIYGDTAMTSFLQQLLDTPLWAKYDSKVIWSDSTSWSLPTIMAILQEHDAALDKRNNQGFTAFDYLEQIVSYDGDDAAFLLLRNVMRRSVKPGLDAHGERCFKFHPMKLYANKATGYDTMRRLRDNPSRWLACEHFCKRGYCGRFGAKWKCGCSTNPFQPSADCEGDCCK